MCYLFSQIVGPLADNTDAIFGGYAPTPDPKYVVSPRAGLAPLATTVSYEPGCNNSAPTCTEYNGDAVKKAVTGADLVVVALGTGQQNAIYRIMYNGAWLEYSLLER